MSAVSNTAADEQLKDAIKRQVEFYFSRSNLANDAFLVSQMNSQMYVPIETIIGFAKIKQLTTSTALVVDAIADSQVVVLNEAKDALKPNIKSERNTIILREIPSATKPEDVKSIFNGCGDVISVRSDVGDTWFVTVSSEDEAVKTLLALRSKTFNGAPIKARLKSENAIKSFFPTPNVEPVTPHVNAYARGYYASQGTGYYDNYGVQYANTNSRGQQQHHNDGTRFGANNHRQGGRGAASVRATPVRVDLPQGRSKGTNVEQQHQQHTRPSSRKAKDKKNKVPGTAGHPSQSAGPAKKPTAAPVDRQPVLNATNFPPLPATETQITTPQYEEIRHHYTHDDILEIVKHMDDNECKLPEGKLDFTLHSVALTPTAHPDLLRNQRTYSIEQAREALRQGRPLRSDSIGSIGSIDYESMMYGEDYTHEARALRKQKAESGVVSTNSAPSTAAATTPLQASTSIGESKTSSADAGKPTTPKVFGYAAAVILGAPTPQPPLDNKKKAATSSTSQDNVKTTKIATKEEKKSNKKSSKKEEKKTVVDETLPKSGAWGGRGFLDVVKTEPPNAVPPPVVVAPAALNKQDRRSKELKDNKDSKENRDRNHNHRRLSPPIPTRAAEDKW